MYLHELKPGTFFEFRQPGFCFRRCMFVGVDHWGYCTFIHQTGGADRFVLNTEVRNDNHPVLVDTNVSHNDWESPKFCPKAES